MSGVIQGILTCLHCSTSRKFKVRIWQLLLGKRVHFSLDCYNLMPDLFLKLATMSFHIPICLLCCVAYSLCIVNDEMFVRNATTEEIRKAFVAPAPTPSSSPVPTLTAAQQEMLNAFSVQSGMNLEWSQK